MALVPDNDSVYYKSVPNIIHTSMLSNDDLELFCDSSELIEKSRKKRKSRGISRLNQSAQLNREEIFEVSEVDEKEYLKIATSAYNDIDVNIKNLSADIEKILESFNDDVSVCEEKEPVVPKCQENKPNRDQKSKEVEIKDKLPKDVVNIRVNLLSTPVSKFRPSFQATSTPTNNLSLFKKAQKPACNVTKILTEPTVNSESISSVKAKISFFNELSKTSCRSQISMMAKTTKTLASKISTIRESSAHAESVCWKPNFVKCRIKQFEKGVISETIDSMINDTQSGSNRLSPKTVHPKNLVSTLKAKFSTPKSIQMVSPASNKTPSIYSNCDRRLNAPRKCINQLPVMCLTETPRKFQASTLEGSKLSSIAESSIDSPEKYSCKNSPEKPISKKYDPFEESEKSLKRLGDIVHTIRSIREQGMTEISRDLFQIFKKSLISANTKLAESKRQSMQMSSATKRIAAVKPHIVPSATFPRVLKAIPKIPEDIDPAKSVSSILAEMKNIQKLNSKNDSSESDLTYERFVSSFERDNENKG